ncbi:hypothetical protein TTHERM_00056030 (macronuclear) [Tetrahymena thermophila SB210]|uniref:Uncharacterized protein n=1 Tax=Tetrahymena thermophila (strain SB210) TaxID=312017 RepID=I7M6U7_TETTS|nr:hypothetical protein TTHERM_00056030 [Tetrahymena thermophila SB210]EAR87289.2 hypothetical protein TTHERM_00056030 [Tetrahymena thermophila SB210]|eukprot:XP_001007534.2 hypothetical protein TTHERM_00056030 [Tetrahymena thermophila SB210]
MVFFRKIKNLENQPCLITKMDLDADRKRICLIDISSTVYIFSTQSLHNLIEDWRFKFQKDLNYADMKSLDTPLFKFSPYELYKPSQVKFSSSICKLQHSAAQILVKDSFEERDHAIKTKIEDSSFQSENQNQTPQAQQKNMTESNLIYQKPKYPRSYTTYSEKSNKKIKINMIYSTEQSMIRQDSSILYSNFKRERIQNNQNNSNNDLYALAIQESRGNIKVYSPLFEINDWIKVANIVYQDNQFSTLDFCWSRESKFIFAIYSDSQLVQYDSAQQFTPIKKFKVDPSANYKIISNMRNDCLLLKNEKNSCQLIDFESKKAYTFEVFKKERGQNNQNQQKNSILQDKQISLSNQNKQNNIHIFPNSQKVVQDKQTNDFCNQNSAGKIKTQFNNQLIMSSQKSNNIIKETNLDDKDEDNEYPSENLSASDEMIVDKCIQENINEYIYETQASVSSDAKYICLGSIHEKGVLLYSVQTKEEKGDIFEWKYGFKKACFEADIDQVEGSSFSEYFYLQDNIQINNYLTKNHSINSFISNLDARIQKSKYNELVLQRILAVGQSKSIIFYSIIDYDNKPQFKKILVVNHLKSEVKNIFWLNAYTLILLLTDYSIIYFKLSPVNIGFAVQIQASDYIK